MVDRFYNSIHATNTVFGQNDIYYEQVQPSLRVNLRYFTVFARDHPDRDSVPVSPKGNKGL
jgi:hypothetical protein